MLLQMAEYPNIEKCSMMFTADKLIASSRNQNKVFFCKEPNSHASLLILLAFRDLVAKKSHLWSVLWVELRKSVTCEGVNLPWIWLFGVLEIKTNRVLSRRTNPGGYSKYTWRGDPTELHIANLKKIHKPEILDPKKHLASKFPTPKNTRLKYLNTDLFN